MKALYICSFDPTEVCVAKNYQGKGWGKKLIQESKKFIKKKKHTCLLNMFK